MTFAVDVLFVHNMTPKISNSRRTKRRDIAKDDDYRS